MPITASTTGYLRAAHVGPTVAVTVLTVLLSFSAGNDAPGVALVAAAVLSGQLSVGWSNDLADMHRDRTAGRRDKPLAMGEISAAGVRSATAVALAVCVVTSMALGAAAGAVHLVLGVGSGWAYNLYLKRTRWSWVPYAIAFGALPAVVDLALDPPSMPPAWMMVAGSLLGVGAHLVNVLPDLADDARTGVRGLPHRLGHRRSALTATFVLILASVVALVGPSGPPTVLAWAALGSVALLGVVGYRSTGRVPFWAAVGIAGVDVALIVLQR